MTNNHAYKNPGVRQSPSAALTGAYRPGSGGGDLPWNGGPALAWQAQDGVVAHGSILRIKTDGTYSFGEKASPAEVLRLFGDDVRENGQPVPGFSAVEDGEELPDGVLFKKNNRAFKDLTTPKRHPRISGMNVRWIEEAQHSEIIPTWGAKNKKLYASWRLKFDYPYTKTCCFKYSDINGKFNTQPDNRTPGEAIRYIRKGEHEETGYVIEVDEVNRHVVIVFDDYYGSISSAHLLPGTIIGEDSGASLTLESIMVSSTKLIRAWQQGYRGIHLTLAENLNQLFLTASDDNYTEIFRSHNQYPPNFPTFSYEEFEDWCLYELEMDYSVSPVRVRYWRNGKVAMADTTPRDGGEPCSDEIHGNPALGPTLSWFGLDVSSPIRCKALMNELYVDTDFKRVYLSSEPEWRPGSPLNELQFISSWSPNEIEVDLNLGQYESAAGLKFYIIDGADNVLAEGALS